MKCKSGLDVAASVATLAVCVLIGVIGVKKFLLNDTRAPADVLRTGTRIVLPGVVWSHADRTLMLALSTQCHFCDESSEFYRRLEPEAVAARVPIVAVFPQPVDVARAHWTGESLPVSGIEFVQAPAGKLPISGTPTVALLDSKGIVLRAWTGKQPASGEAEIIHEVEQ